MKILTKREARAAKLSIDAFLNIGQPYFSTTIGEGDSAVTVECDEGIITVKNSNTTEVYNDIRTFAEDYDVMYSL